MSTIYGEGYVADQMSKQPEALRLADGLEKDWHACESNHVMLDSANELRRLHAANVELVGALKANQIAEAMPIYGDSSDFVWPKSEMRKPGDTAWGWICEKHGLGYQSGCICCSSEFDNYRERKNQDARYSRDQALRAASEKARAAIAKHGATS